MNILAIETATDACSAALYCDGHISEQFIIAPREHTRLILPMIAQLVADASLSLQQIDYFAFGRGPGAFTGVRIATGVIQGLAFAVDRAVIPVSTLAALAQGAYRISSQRKILTAMDARMGEVYWAAYTFNENGHIDLAASEQVIGPDAITMPEDDGWSGCGNGWAAYPLARTTVTAVDESMLPHAQDIAVIAAQYADEGINIVQAADALPVYLRDTVAKKKGEQKS
jgi:tRNA threonylcarbamoyladenosine biosynthesis protein TsaB